MKKKIFKRYPALFLGIALIIVILIIALVNGAKGPGELDEFATCINESGSKFYGAYWCSHCQNQKDMFGKSKKYLPYVECSTPNGNGQTLACEEAGIESYPTWVFPDGAQEVGEQSLEELASKTDCSLERDI
jgi:hypothetical protein